MDGRGFKFSLIFGIVTCFLSGTGVTAQNSSTTYMNELQGRSALLPLNNDPEKTVTKIKLDFESRTGEKNNIAEISNGTLKCTKACGRFGQRLKMISETDLRINDLEMEGSGVYKAHVMYVGNVYPTNSFNLTVYAPVPEPQIKSEATKVQDGFNVTLQCLVPGAENIDISWGRGDPIRPLEENLSGNGTVLPLFCKPSSPNSTITCQASNLVDQKNTSFDLNSICRSEGADQLLYILLLYILVLFILVILFFVIPSLICWKWKALKSTFQKRFCKRNSTPNGTEVPAPRVDYAKCPRSEPNNISDSTPPHPTPRTT